MSKSTDQRVSVKPWLKWAWFHYSLNYEEFDTFEDAVAASIDAAESLMAIEGPHGAVSDEVLRAERDRQTDAARAQWTEGPRCTHGVRLDAPNATDQGRDWSWVETFPSEQEAESLAASLRDRFGARVSVVALR